MTSSDMKRLVIGKRSSVVVLEEKDAWRANGPVIESQSPDGWEPIGMFGDDRDARFAARKASAHYRIVAKAQRLLDALEGQILSRGALDAANELRKEIRG